MRHGNYVHHGSYMHNNSKDVKGKDDLRLTGAHRDTKEATVISRYYTSGI